MGWACGAYGWGEGVYRVLVGKPEGRRPLGRPRCRWVDNIRTDLQELGCGYMDWIGLAQNRDRWRTLVSAVMNLRVLWNAGNFLTSCKPVSFSRRTLHHTVSTDTRVTATEESRRLLQFNCLSYKQYLAAVTWKTYKGYNWFMRQKYSCAKVHQSRNFISWRLTVENLYAYLTERTVVDSQNIFLSSRKNEVEKHGDNLRVARTSDFILMMKGRSG